MSQKKCVQDPLDYKPASNVDTESLKNPSALAETHPLSETCPNGAARYGSAFEAHTPSLFLLAVERLDVKTGRATRAHQKLPRSIAGQLIKSHAT